MGLLPIDIKKLVPSDRVAVWIDIALVTSWHCNFNSIEVLAKHFLVLMPNDLP